MNKFVQLRSLAARQLAASYCMEAPDGFAVEFKPTRRSVEQNAALWAKLDDIAAQVVWYGKKLTAEDWKDVFTASLRKARVVPTIDGDGFVPLGMSTSRMTKEEMNNLLSLIDAFAAERGVVFSAGDALEEMRR